MSEENVEQGEKDSSKVKKQFDEALKSFVAILGGETLLTPTKLNNPNLQIAINELAAEEVQEKITTFKTKAKALIKKKAEHDKHVADMEKEFEKKKEESMKGFISEANDLKKLIADIGGIQKKYYDALTSAASGEKMETN